MADSKLRAVFLVHVLTASGAAFALLALQAAVSRQWAAMFFWLGAALIVDGLDGPLARWFAVAEVMPRWSGATLDLVVDYATYVFVPAYAIAHSGLLPDAFATLAGAAIVVTGALYFSDGNMKTADHYFLGFPAIWNVAAFYVLLLTPPPWLTLGSVVVLAGATFVPVAFVHPLRVARWRLLTLALLLAWAMLGLAALWYEMNPGPWVVMPLCLIATYMIAVGLLRGNARQG